MIIKEKTTENWNICKIDKSLVYKSVIVKLVMVTTLATKKKKLNLLETENRR